MPAARTALLLVLVASSARAAPFDDLKADLASCLRFELDGARSVADVPKPSRTGFALQRCGVEMDRLERSDGRRLRGDGGISPSTRSVIESVLGGDRGRFTKTRL